MIAIIFVQLGLGGVEHRAVAGSAPADGIRPGNTLPPEGAIRPFGKPLRVSEFKIHVA